jgi:hypothetical protein
MKRSTAIASLLLASAVTVQALAADAASSGSGRFQTDAATDNGTTASTGAADFDSLIASIKADSTNVGAISSLTTVGSVTVVRANDLAKGENMQALQQAIDENHAAVTDLQAAIAANPALKAKLDAQNIAASSIVAADVGQDGSLTVYVK